MAGKATNKKTTVPVGHDHHDKDHCCCACLEALACAAAAIHDQHCHCQENGDLDGCSCCEESLALVLKAIQLHLDHLDHSYEAKRAATGKVKGGKESKE